jgi:hypothetical protein
MARARIIHFRPEEAAPLPEAVRNCGFIADYSESPHGRDITRAIQAYIPEIGVVIDLTRLPSHGKEIGVWLRGRKANRHVPPIFTDGEPEKVAKVRELLPDAAKLLEDPDTMESFTIWFIHEPEAFLAALPRMRTIAPKTKLRVLWRKGRQYGFTQNFVGEAGIAFAGKKL